MLVMRNVNTDSPWPLSNNPKAKYNDPNLPDSNLKLPLWQLVRASTAAPTFFPPEKVQLGNREFIFVDGGVTAYNNPAFQLFLMATLEPYQLMWPTGEDNMLLVSVGTGLTPNINPELTAAKVDRTIYNAINIPGALMLAAQQQQDFLCRTFGKCLCGEVIDGEVGDLIDVKGPLESKLFTYVRYNAELTREGLKRLGLEAIKPEDVQQMDSVKHMDKLEKIGQAIAKKVKLEHFANFLP